MWWDKLASSECPSSNVTAQGLQPARGAAHHGLHVQAQAGPDGCAVWPAASIFLVELHHHTRLTRPPWWFAAAVPQVDSDYLKQTRARLAAAAAKPAQKRKVAVLEDDLEINQLAGGTKDLPLYVKNRQVRLMEGSGS